MREELGRLVALDFVGGYRGRRRVQLARYITSGRLRNLDGIYVESSTFMPAEVDIAFLGLARALGIPVLTYVRDAYQLFPEYDASSSLRRRLARAAFRPSMRALRAVSSRLAFPSRGLARVIIGSDEDAVLIPPGSPAPSSPPLNPDARSLLFVGNGRLAAQGAPRLIEAVARSRNDGLDIRLTIVSRPGEEPLPPHPEWLDIVNAGPAEIRERLPSIVASVIPRPRVPYNDLAVPVKLYDYLAHGRPLLVTDCEEQARVVTDADAGIVCGDSPAAIAAAISRLFGADLKQRATWGANAAQAALENSWQMRASAVLVALGVEN